MSKSYDNKAHGAGRPPQFDKQINTALETEEDSLREPASAESRQRQAKNSVRKIGEIYHPVDRINQRHHLWQQAWWIVFGLWTI